MWLDPDTGGRIWLLITNHGVALLFDVNGLLDFISMALWLSTSASIWFKPQATTNALARRVEAGRNVAFHFKLCFKVS